MKKKSHHVGNQLRIIAGEWRGRKLNFPDAEGLRPTPDRVRETVFNWLQAVMPGAFCVDLFAGSGAMGFEALSRGAGRVVMIERDLNAFRSLQANVALLNTADRVQLYQGDALERLVELPRDSVDILFLDPPYGKGLIAKVWLQLEQAGVLKEDALIYLEQEKPLQADDLPQNRVILKQKQAGQVNYYLLRST